MMNKELLIQQAKDGYGDDAAAFISDSLDGFVIVPVELIQNIDDITEAGFGAEDQIDELCALLEKQQ